MKKDSKAKGNIVLNGIEERLINDGWQKPIIESKNLLTSNWQFSDLHRFMYVCKIINNCKKVNPLVLDIGCSTGRLLQVQQNLARTQATKAMKYVGLDARDEALKFIKQYAEENLSEAMSQNVYVENKNIVDVESCKKLVKEYGKFDVIVMLEVIEHIPTEHVQNVLKSLKNMLSDEGILIVSTPIHFKDEEMWWPEAHFYEYKLDELKNIFEKNFEIIEMCGNHVIAKELKEKLKQNEEQNKLYKQLLKASKNGVMLNELFGCVNYDCCKGIVISFKKRGK